MMQPPLPSHPRVAALKLQANPALVDCGFLSVATTNDREPAVSGKCVFRQAMGTQEHPTEGRHGMQVRVTEGTPETVRGQLFI